MADVKFNIVFLDLAVPVARARVRVRNIYLSPLIILIFIFYLLFLSQKLGHIGIPPPTFF